MANDMADLVVGCKAEEVYTFPSFENWVNKASSRIGGVAKANNTILVCIDAGGYLCNQGSDFMAARDNNRFPVTAYLLTRSANVKCE